MNTGPCNKGRAAFFGSIGLNIFLLAFVLGRASMPGLMQPPPFGMGHHMPPGMYDDMPPPPFGGMHHGHKPPSFFSPADLFSPEEMQEDFAVMQQNFETIGKLRQDFAKRLEQDGVTKEEVIEHFAEIDQFMDKVKKQMQEKAAAKISTMSPDERKRFADRLLEEK